MAKTEPKAKSGDKIPELTRDQRVVAALCERQAWKQTRDAYKSKIGRFIMFEKHGWRMLVGPLYVTIYLKIAGEADLKEMNSVHVDDVADIARRIQTI